LINTELAEAIEAPVTMVLNWWGGVEWRIDAYTAMPYTQEA